MKSEFTTSRSLLLIAAGLILIGAATGVFITFQMASLRHDAEAINRLGIIRGSMQRMAKQEIAGIPSETTIAGVDSLMAGFVGNQTLLSFDGGREFQSRMHLLQAQWNQMKKTARDFRTAPDTGTRHALLVESERCWAVANQAVFAAQFASEAKLRLFRVVFILIGLNIVVILGFIRFNRSQVRNRLELLAHHDALTGAWNRYVYEARLEEEIQRSRRYDRPLSLILLDIDHFKQVNDTWGHKKGDRVLQTVTGVIAGGIRRFDSLCRVGGEEFAIIAPETDREGALALAEKLRSGIESTGFQDIPKVTVSLGVAQHLPGEEPSVFFRRADQALYAAKAGGRNRVRTDEPESGDPTIL